MNKELNLVKFGCVLIKLCEFFDTYLYGIIAGIPFTEIRLKTETIQVSESYYS